MNTVTPTIGRIVRYVLPEGHSHAGEIRPAIITRVRGMDCVQLTPFVDVANDEPVNPTSCSSVVYDELKKPRSWHWPDDGQPSKPTPLST